MPSNRQTTSRGCRPGRRGTLSTFDAIGIAGIGTDAMPGVGRFVVLRLDAFEDHRLTVLRDLDARGVERPEIEQFLLAVVVGRLLEIVGGAVVDREDVGLRRVADVDGGVVGLPADYQRRPRAAQMQVDDRLRLVESEFLEVRGRRCAGDQLISSARFRPSPTRPSTAEKSARAAIGLIIFQSALALANSIVLPSTIDVHAVDLRAVELDDRLVAQVEGGLVERAFVVLRDQHDALLIVASGVAGCRRSRSWRRRTGVRRSCRRPT